MSQTIVYGTFPLYLKFQDEKPLGGSSPNYSKIGHFRFHSFRSKRIPSTTCPDPVSFVAI